jgi:hypothetical protein
MQWCKTPTNAPTKRPHAKQLPAPPLPLSIPEQGNAPGPQSRAPFRHPVGALKPLEYFAAGLAAVTGNPVIIC